MEFIYDEYDRNSVFLAHGEYALVLVDMSGVEFGDGEAQLGAIKHLKEPGWIKLLPTSRTRRRTGTGSTSKIKPTIDGIRHVKERRQPWFKRHWPSLVTALTEGVVRGIKK